MQTAITFQMLTALILEKIRVLFSKGDHDLLQLLDDLAAVEARGRRTSRSLRLSLYDAVDTAPALCMHTAPCEYS